MPDTPGGIGKAGDEEAVNTNAGFEAAMAAKGIEREQADSLTDTDVSSGLTYARDEAGRFTSSPPVEEAPDEADPLEQYIMSQHGGDVQAALAALYQENTNQKSVIGRQGRELGDVRAQREELAELRGRVETLQQFAIAPPVEHMSGEQADEYAAELIQRHGYTEAATQAANIAFNSGDDTVYGKVIDQWNLEEPYQALTHVADFRAWQRSNEVVAQVPAAEPDEWVAEQKTVQALREPLEKLSSDLGEERWGVVAPRMEAALEALPQGVAELVVSDDPETSYQGLQIVAERAYLMGMAEDQQQAARTQRKMAGAGVATGSLRPPGVSSRGEATPDAVAAATQRFKQSLLETETTDVRSGLTFGKTTQPTP